MLTFALILSTALIGGHKHAACSSCSTAAYAPVVTLVQAPVYASSCYSSSRQSRKAYKHAAKASRRASACLPASATLTCSACPPSSSSVGYASYTSVTPGVQSVLPTPQAPSKNVPVVNDGPDPVLNPAPVPAPNVNVVPDNTPIPAPVPDNVPVPLPVPVPSLPPQI